MGEMYKRSPFLSFYWDQDSKLTAFNCNEFAHVRVPQHLIFLLDRLSDWTSVNDLSRQLPGSEEPAIRRMLTQLVEAHLLITYPPGPEDELPEDTYWSNIDLAMQRQSSYGGFDEGGLRSREPPPAFKQPPAGEVIPLVKAELDPGLRFQMGLAARRSIRTYGSSPLTLHQLSQFLYASAAVQDVYEDPLLGQMSHRPYASGGARHPLEIYPICNEVSGLQKGVYYYNPLNHSLIFLKAADDHQKGINEWLRSATTPSINRDPSVVFLITACFARTMWKYQRIALSIILKDVGCLYQTMYCVATALQLAPCAIGGGLERDNSHWLGLNSLRESQVGCFLIGRKVERERIASNDS